MAATLTRDSGGAWEPTIPTNGGTVVDGEGRNRERGRRCSPRQRLGAHGCPAARREAVVHSGSRQHSSSGDAPARVTHARHRTHRGEAGGEVDGGGAPREVAQIGGRQACGRREKNDDYGERRRRGEMRFSGIDDGEERRAVLPFIGQWGGQGGRSGSRDLRRWLRIPTHTCVKEGDKGRNRGGGKRGFDVHIFVRKEEGIAQR